MYESSNQDCNRNGENVPCTRQAKRHGVIKRSLDVERGRVDRVSWYTESHIPGTLFVHDKCPSLKLAPRRRRLLATSNLAKITVLPDRSLVTGDVFLTWLRPLALHGLTQQIDG